MSALKTKDYPLDLNKKFNIAYINICTEAEGPYKRMAIWFQGCSIRCRGCCNPELQEIKAAHIMSIEEILNVALKSKDENGIEGVTFLGGEPTMQSNLSELARAFQDNGLGVILFTGKDKAELSDDLIRHSDMIIDGKFDIDQIDTQRNLIGSTNQIVHYISNRYLKSKDWFENSRGKLIEINIDPYSNSFISGDVL